MTMPENMTRLEMSQRWVLVGALLVLACLLFLCLIRAVKGPRVADRIVAVNMMGTMVMVIIAIMTLLLHEGYLADICLIYAMISFLAVIVLSKVYMGVYLQRKRDKDATGEALSGGSVKSAGVEMAGKSGKEVSVEPAKPSGIEKFSKAGMPAKTENEAAVTECCGREQINPASKCPSPKKKENTTVNSQGGSFNA